MTTLEPSGYELPTNSALAITTIIPAQTSIEIFGRFVSVEESVDLATSNCLRKCCYIDPPYAMTTLEPSGYELPTNSALAITTIIPAQTSIEIFGRFVSVEESVDLATSNFLRKRCYIDPPYAMTTLDPSNDTLPTDISTPSPPVALPNSSIEIFGRFVSVKESVDLA